MTATLFELPPRNRTLAGMRDGIVRRLCELDRLTDWETDAQRSFAYRLEKLLRCVENTLAPGLAKRRDELERQSEQRNKDAKLQREIDAERKADAKRAKIDSDPGVKAALAKLAPLQSQYDAADRAEIECEKQLIATQDRALRKRLTVLRAKTTRAANLLDRAHREVYKARRDTERVQKENA